MRVLFTCFFLLFSIGLLFSSCSPKSDDNTTESSTEDISISSSSSDNASVTFGQTFLHQLTTTGTYSGEIKYSLSNQPEGMTISSSGLIEWTPTKASQITTHSNITITLTTASGYVITQSFDLSVTGTCTSGNVMAIWTGDQRTSTDSSKFLSNITAYTDNESDICGQNNNLDCTPSNNYDYRNSKVHLTYGPTAVADKGNMFFYNQHDNSSYSYLFWNFGVDATHSYGTTVHIDAYTTSNTSSDSVIVSDDQNSTPYETNRESQSESEGLYSSTYTTRAKYSNNYSDGAVIGPFSGKTYRIFIDLGGESALTPTHSTSSSEDTTASGVSGNNLGLGALSAFKFWSKDGSSFSLTDVDNFTVGYKTSIDCSN